MRRADLAIDQGGFAMGGRLREDIARLLAGLEATQAEMLALFDRKRIALRKARAQELLKIADEEAALVKRLQQHVAERERLLRESGSCETVGELLTRLNEPEDSRLQKRLQQVCRNAERLRRESWVQWIVAQRAHRHYCDVLEIIAHRGGSAPTYSKTRNAGNTAGALLDTSI